MKASLAILAASCLCASAAFAQTNATTNYAPPVEGSGQQSMAQQSLSQPYQYHKRHWWSQRNPVAQGPNTGNRSLDDPYFGH